MTNGPRDYADGSARDQWLQHPFCGEASFDSFVRHPANPIVRGAAPLEWPVNGFLFEDPVSGNWYLYVGFYPQGYAIDSARPTTCIVYRSADAGAMWTKIGPIFDNVAFRFDGDQHTAPHAPDVSVTYSDGRYHLVYDWAHADATWDQVNRPKEPHGGIDSGVGYAWSDSPEGPFIRASVPILRNSTQPVEPLLGKYGRVYASTIIRRTLDWLVLSITDCQPYPGWGLVAMTAQQPEGPYTLPQPVFYSELPTYHLPMQEYFPAFVYDGYVYAPATALGYNRNFQVIQRAPVDAAHATGAWQIFQHGSAWHAEPEEHEHYGIWGQTFTGFVDRHGQFHVMFPSRDSHGFGTINLAARPWAAPYRQRGFHLSGHEGASIALLGTAHSTFELSARFEFKGEIGFVWGHTGPIGATFEPGAGRATVHPLMRSRCATLHLTPATWHIAVHDQQGTGDIIAHGSLEQAPSTLDLTVGAETASVSINGARLWHQLPTFAGRIGLYVEPWSSAAVDRFAIAGETQPTVQCLLYTDALLGAAQLRADWVDIERSAFRFGVGGQHVRPGGVAKWNVRGSRVRVWSPCCPQAGQVVVLVDGQPVAQVDLHAAEWQASQPVYEAQLVHGYHAVTLVAVTGVLVVDSLEVEA